MPDVSSFLTGALFNLVSALVLVAGIYYRRTPKREFTFSYLAFNVVVYSVMALLARSELSIGVGFGLFAIFSVLRYRTEETSFREMTYLFVVIALPVVNALLVPAGDLGLAAAANAFVLLVVFLVEQGWGFSFLERQPVRYERLDLVVPSRRPELIADLRARTGLEVESVEVKRIDLLMDVADLVITYCESAGPRPAVSSLAPRAVEAKE
ncbi:MAG: DUF4956 domain-containing protein [Trueperaceae bacterium]